MPMPTKRRWVQKRRQRRVFELYSSGMGVEHVAAVLRISPKAARRVLRRAGVEVVQATKKEQR